MEFNQLEHKLGYMMWPLLICSFITGMVLLERICCLLFSARLQRAALHQRLPLSHPLVEEHFSIKVLQQHSCLLWQGVMLLLVHRQTEKPLREEMAALWLQRQRQKLTCGIRLLTLVSVISPLLGLLGTIFGLIQMFQTIGTSHHAVTPALLADGLGVAMYTTAAGLLIALPALIGVHLLNGWIDRIINIVELEMNHYNLWLEGITQSGERL